MKQINIKIASFRQIKQNRNYWWSWEPKHKYVTRKRTW